MFFCFSGPDGFHGHYAPPSFLPSFLLFCYSQSLLVAGNYLLRFAGQQISSFIAGVSGVIFLMVFFYIYFFSSWEPFSEQLLSRMAAGLYLITFYCVST